MLDNFKIKERIAKNFLHLLKNYHGHCIPVPPFTLKGSPSTVTLTTPLTLVPYQQTLEF